MSIPPDSISSIPLPGSLMNTSANLKNDGAWNSLFQLLVSNDNTGNPLFSDPLSPLASNAAISSSVNIKGLSASGRNMALADPESAYKMMSIINHIDSVVKVQYSELGQMKAAVSQMQEAAGALAKTDNIKLGLLGFVGQYNNWISRFTPDLKPGGALAGTQAAEVAQYELEQNLKTRFPGAGDGIPGMGGLGIAIDPFTHLASLDVAKLDAQLSNNKQGVVNTVQEFSANFAKSAGLLVSDGNFFSRQLDNLDRGMHFIADNKDALQQEFGTGDAAPPAEHNASSKT